MKRALHILIPPATAPLPLFGLTAPLQDNKMELEVVTLTPENAGTILEKIFSSDSISVWQKL